MLDAEREQLPEPGDGVDRVAPVAASGTSTVVSRSPAADPAARSGAATAASCRSRPTVLGLELSPVRTKYVTTLIATTARTITARVIR